MNETEREIVAWLRQSEEDTKLLAYGGFAHRLDLALRCVRASRAKRLPVVAVGFTALFGLKWHSAFYAIIADAIENGEHRQHSPAKDD